MTTAGIPTDPRIRERSGAASNGSQWWVTERPPAPALRGHIRGYSDYLEAEPGPFRRRHEPSGYVTWILNFADPLKVEMPQTGAHIAAPSFVAGVHQTWAQTDSSGYSRGLEVGLTPPAARALFGVRMSALAGDVADLRELLGAAGRVLLERLEAAPTSAARFDLLDEALGAALAKADETPPAVREAWERLRDADGRLGISRLAGDLGSTRKALLVGFDEHVGLRPKTVARIFRFQRAIRGVDEGLAWTELAAECGYYDQSHLIRDFRQFAGMKPSEFMRRRSGNGGVVG